ncbi:MAG: hypothetical protein U0T81_10450 [Saprospiraceae bacterium]
MSATHEFHFDNLKRPLNFFVGLQAVVHKIKLLKSRIFVKGYILLDSGIVYSLPQKKFG